MTHGVLAEAFRAEAQRLSEVFDCAYFAQEEPSGHYQEVAPGTGPGLALGLRTSGPAGDLFLTADARQVGNLEVEESDSEELVSLMRAAATGHASTRNARVFGRTVALRLRFDDTTWAFPTPFLVGLFPSRDHCYEPWPKRTIVTGSGRGGSAGTKRLTKDELDELDRLWSRLARLSVRKGPPMTDDEAIEAGVDALLAGVISGAGQIGREGLAVFESALSMKAESPALQSVLDRIAAVLGLDGQRGA